MSVRTNNRLSLVKWPLVPLRRILTGIEQGWSPVAQDTQADEGEWGVLKISAVKRGTFNQQEHKALRDVEPRTKYEVRPGDILLTRANTPEMVGDICLVGECRQHLMLSDLIYRLSVNEQLVVKKYLIHWFCSRPGRDQIEVDARGSSQSMVKVSQGHIKEWLIPMPSLWGQYAIADYLDRKTAAIDALIEKKERLIALLAEKRAALINQAVTKGLNPDAPMKDSEVPWIGEIPAHWEMMRLKSAVTSIEQGWSPSCENRTAEVEEWGVLKVGCVNWGRFNEAEHKALPNDLAPLSQYEIRAGDLLMSRANTKDLVGSTALVHDVRQRLMLCDKLYRLRCNCGLDARYAAILMASSCARFQLERDSSGASASMQNISQDKVREILLPFPPSTEQAGMVERVSALLEGLHGMSSTVQHTIERLHEYRQALITAAVTGQIDVNKEAL